MRDGSWLGAEALTAFYGHATLVLDSCAYPFDRRLTIDVEPVLEDDVELATMGRPLALRNFSLFLFHSVTLLIGTVE